jgi:hypothetical protein
MVLRHHLLLRLLSSCTILRTASIDGVAQGSEERPTMRRHRHLHRPHHQRCAQLFMPLPSLPLWERARNGRLCHQGPLFCLATIVVMHHPQHCHHRCLCMSKQGAVDNAKAPSSLPPPPSSLSTIVNHTAMIAIAQEGEEQPMMPPWHRLPLHHRLSMRPLLLPSRKQARDGYRWSQGTIFCSSTIVVAHHHPHCCH